MFLALAIICDDYFVPALEEISSVVLIMMRYHFLLEIGIIYVSGIRNSIRRQIKLLLIFIKKYADIKIIYLFVHINLKYDDIFDADHKNRSTRKKTLFLALFRPLVSLPSCQTAYFYTLGLLLHMANPGYLRSIGPEPGCCGGYFHGCRWFRSRVVHKFGGCFHRFKRWNWYDCWFSRFQYIICDWCLCFCCQLH